MKKVTKIDEIVSVSSADKKIKVAAYCRVSTDSDAQLESLDAQKTHYENYISSRDDWEFVGLYYDEGISGTKKEKRYELMRMINDCEAGKIDFVITKSISRLTRNTADCLELVRKLLDLNIPIFFEKENINTGSMESELFLSLLSSMAEDESTSISENSKWSIQKRFQNGTYKISYPPYGYANDNGQMVVVPEQAIVIKRIFHEALLGKGTRAIATSLNKDSIPTKRGGSWSAGTINGILKNEKYTGDVIFQKTFSDSQFNRHTNRGEMDQYYMQDHHEALISHEDFDKVQAMIEQRAKEKGNTREQDKYLKRYEFSGKVICGECSNTFKRRVHNSTHQKYTAWCCNTHIENKNACSMLYVRDDVIKTAFITMINKLIFGNNILLKPLAENLKNHTEDRRLLRIQQIQKELLQNTEKRETMQKLMAQGYIDHILYNKENNELLTEADNLRKEADMIYANLTGNSSRINSVKELMRFADKSDMQVEYNDELFTQFVDRIIVYSRNEVGFELKCGLILRERM